MGTADLPMQITVANSFQSLEGFMVDGNSFRMGESYRVLAFQSLEGFMVDGNLSIF